MKIECRCAFELNGALICSFKKLARVSWVFCLVLMLSACEHEEPKKIDPLSELSNEPPAEGSCVGWRRNLVEGGAAVGELNYCLKEKVTIDPEGAAADAKELLVWDIKDNSQDQLTATLNRLNDFPNNSALREFLNGHKLLVRGQPEDDGYAEPITVLDFIEQLGNTYWFDVETGMFPNHHDGLMRDIASLSDLKGVVFSEEPPGDYDSSEENYKLSAKVGDKVYHQEAKNHGDWYDVGAVLTMLNHIAVDQGAKSRFLILPVYDQTATVWVVHNEKLALLLERGLFVLDEAERAMVSGKSYQNDDGNSDELNKP